MPRTAKTPCDDQFISDGVSARTPGSVCASATALATVAAASSANPSPWFGFASINVLVRIMLKLLLMVRSSCVTWSTSRSRRRAAQTQSAALLLGIPSQDPGAERNGSRTTLVLARPDDLRDVGQKTKAVEKSGKRDVRDSHVARVLAIIAWCANPLNRGVDQNFAQQICGPKLVRRLMNNSDAHCDQS